MAGSWNDVGDADLMTSTAGGSTGLFVIVQLTTSPGSTVMPIDAPLTSEGGPPPTTAHDQPSTWNAPAPGSSVKTYTPAGVGPDVAKVPGVVKSIVPSSVTGS